jgi:glycine oxidase
LLHLRAVDGVPLLTHNIRGLDVYIVTRPDGRLIVGASVEERGFDSVPTAGAVHDLLRFAYELVPGITELELVEVSVGHRPGTPDNAPVLGGTSVQNLFIASGHYRNGILLLPITARSIAELIRSGVTPQEIAPFAPARFERANQPS